MSVMDINYAMETTGQYIMVGPLAYVVQKGAHKKVAAIFQWQDLNRRSLGLQFTDLPSELPNFCKKYTNKLGQEVTALFSISELDMK